MHPHNPASVTMTLIRETSPFASKTADEWTKVTIDRGGVGRYTSLAMDSSGNPRIGYQDLSNMKLKYAERNSGLFWTNETVDSGNPGAYASLALDGTENPHISYYDAGHGFLNTLQRMRVCGRLLL